MTAMELVVFLLALVGAAIIGGVIDGVVSSALRKRKTAVRVIYDKHGSKVTAGEIRAIDNLYREGNLVSDARLTPRSLKLLIGCTHLPADRPCAQCLGYSSEQEMRDEE